MKLIILSYKIFKNNYFLFLTWLKELFKKKKAKKFSGVIVGEVKEVNKHPNADRLKLVKVDIGNQELKIVCGAPNVSAGQKVPVATVGAILPNDIVIKKSKIRGEESEGMICAEDELGFGENHEGIMVLDSEAKVGDDLEKHVTKN